MLVPQISGFKIRPLQLSDAAAWASYACLPEVRAHTSSTATTVEDVLAVLQRSNTGEPNSPIHFALIPEGGSTVVATVGFHTISAANGSAEITYDVAPVHWGKGIASASCRAATLWGFAAKGWHRVQATALLTNDRSLRVLENCGFKREGLVRNFRVVRGFPADYWLYSAIPGEVQNAA
jgi:ribosomal-protein-alanine N-acetyltransferase